MRSTRRTDAAAAARGPGATATTKLRPPAPPAPSLRRERLVALLEEGLGRRLTTVVAGAGFGKSALLSAWAADVNCAWYSASSDDASLAAFARGVTDALRLRVPALPADDAGAVTASAGPGAEEDEPARARGFAAAVCETLQSELTRDLVLVVDDVHEVTSPGAIRVIESLCRQAPPQLHLVLASRSELPFPIERLRGQGHVLELSSADLTFDVDEIQMLLTTATGPGDAATALELHRATGGWPAAVRLAVEALRGVPPAGRRAALERIRRPGGPLIAYLASEVFAQEPPEVEALVRTVAPLERFTAGLCEALGVVDATEILQSLARRGLFVELQGDGETAGWYALGSPVREFALSRRDPGGGEARRVRSEAARWLEAHDETEDALRCFAAAGEVTELARILTSEGPALLARGSVDAVLEAVALVPRPLRTPPIEQLAGEAFQVRGDWDEALRCFERAAGDADPLPPGLAWRMGLLRHLVGRLDEAFAAYGRAGVEGEPRDVALLFAWRASAHWLRGDADACREDAENAFAVASEADDPKALAAAHTVLAMLAALEGDRAGNDAHYLKALDHAEEAGDVLQLIRVRTNRGSRHVEECAYDEAIAELDLALRLADLAGFAAFRALALSNRGEALSKLGRFDEAVADLEAARALYQRLGSRMVAYPLEKLGEVYRMRGQWALARASFEEAVAQAEASGDLQGLVPSLAGLARVTAADEPDEAKRLVERVLGLGEGLSHVYVLLSAGWVALVHGERERATEWVAHAAATARTRRDRAGLAESLELGVLASRHPAGEIERLDEAAAIWRDLRSPVGEARVALEIALLTGDAHGASNADDRLRALGARGYRAAFSRLVSVDASPRVLVQSLGRFRVTRGGEVIPLAAWQSRKARDLFKMLVARRGRPAPREALMEALWPGQSAAPLANRLSVLLSTVRAVLDPEKRHEPDHFVAADRSSVRLQPEHVSVDVEEFLTAAGEALGLRRAGAPEAHEQLTAAEAAYTGDFLEEDAYEDWALALREECGAVYTEVVRALACDAISLGDPDAAIRFHLRILERDPYDEPAHLGLVTTLEAAGRHGEARRCFRAYCARMDEIGIESAPFPGVHG
jgi:ATP/maltotriose-dependent transcriptional regulator MalT/DNA-binding SARP family transcriptional activator